jgi:RecB family exonuclease
MIGADLRDAVVAHLPREAWPQALILVPHRGAQHTLQQALQSLGPGRLPQIVMLADPDPWAANLGLVTPPRANSWPLRAQALRLLQEAHPAMAPTALIPRTESLLQSLNLLAEHSITPAALAASVPPELSEVWGFHGAILLQLWQAAAPAAARLLPAGRRQQVWRQITPHLATPPRAVWWAPAPATPGLQGIYRALQPQEIPLRSATPSPLFTLTAPHPWAEVQRLTLWVALQLQQGATRVAVVASDPLASRLVTELRVRLGVCATTTGGTRWGATAAGQALLLAAQSWATRTQELSMEYWLRQLPPLDLPTALQQVLEDLCALPGRCSGPLALAWLRQALSALAGHDDALRQTDPRVHILPAHVATQQPWEALAIAGLNEGVWPVAPNSSGLSQAQRRALGLPDAQAQADHAAQLLQQLQQQGAKAVLMSRSTHDDAGNPWLPSRWWPSEAPPLAECYQPGGWVCPPAPARLGGFQVAQPPPQLSPSLLELMLACPYRAYAERSLRLQPLPPLRPLPNQRTRGVVLHRWLAAMLQQYPRPQAVGTEKLTAALRASAPQFLTDCTPLEQALWLPKMLNLAPAVAAAWAAMEATWRTEVPLQATVQGLQIIAHADALATTAAGTVVLDYKTGTPPSPTQVQRGEKPQLALEGWLLQQQGTPLMDLVYWHLKGFGPAPLPHLSVTPDATVLGPVAPTLQAVQAAYFEPNRTWPATPDAAGGGVVASGPCEQCHLAGVCRRQAWAQTQATEAAA